MDLSTDSDFELLKGRVEELEQREKELSRQREDMENDFGQKRAKFKELYLQKEEELNQEHEVLETLKKEKELLEEQAKKLQEELDECRSLVTIAECQKENAIENEKRKCQEEVATVQHLMNEAVSEAVRTNTSRFEKEVSRMKKTNEKLEAELSELRSQQSRDSEGMLAVVTKSLKQKVGGLSLNVSSDSTENLEESMRKAQEDAEMLRSLVIPLEEEIKALKDKLRSTDEQLQIYEGAFSGLIKGLGSNSLAEMVKDSSPALVIEHLDEKLTSLSQGLQAEKASRSDLEMYVAVLNTQKSVIQEDMDRMKKELQDVCHLLEKEKREHNALKRTWQMANDQFLETQRLHIMDLRRMQNVLTSEQQRQISDMKRKDEENLEKEKLSSKVQAREESNRLHVDSLSRSPVSQTSPLNVSQRSLTPTLHRRLRSADSKSSCDVDEFSHYEVIARSAPENLSLSGLEVSPRSRTPEILRMSRPIRSLLSARERKLQRSLSVSALSILLARSEAMKDKKDDPETRSLQAWEDFSRSPWSPKKPYTCSRLTQDQMKALSDLTPELEARTSLLESAKANYDTFSLVGKRLVSEKEWKLLEEELRRSREKVGQPCQMCGNYELQLQQVQQMENKKQQQLSHLEDILERYKQDLQKEQSYREEMDQKYKEMAENSSKQIRDVFKQLEETEKAFAEVNATFTRYRAEIQEHLKNVISQRDELKIQISELFKENSALLGKYIATSNQIQNEIIDLPNTAEDMQYHYLQMREKLITVLQQKEQALGDIVFMKEQLKSEKHSKDALEFTMSQEIDSLQENVGIVESIKTELECERNRREDTDSRLQKLQDEFQHFQNDKNQKCNSLEQQLNNMTELKRKLETEIQDLKIKIQGLQTDLDNSEAVQRDFVKLSQSLQMELEKIRNSDCEIRWQHDDDVLECSSCKKKFLSKKEKLHCNHCGKIFCVDCNSKSVFSGPKRRQFRVCNVCHTLLDRATAPYFSCEPPQTPS